MFLNGNKSALLLHSPVPRLLIRVLLALTVRFLLGVRGLLVIRADDGADGEHAAHAQEQKQDQRTAAGRQDQRPTDHGALRAVLGLLPRRRRGTDRKSVV